MTRLKRGSVLVVVFVMLGLLLTACTGGTDSASGGKTVNLVMYLIGEQPADYPAMLEQLNAKMQEDINATLEVRWLGWGDYKQRYPLILSSGEPFDLIFSGDWVQYQLQAKKGAFYPMDELLPEYAPVSYEEEPDIAWDQARVDGKIYMLPMNYTEVNPHGFVVRGDLRKKYGIGDINTLADFGAYLDAVKKNEPDMIPYHAGSFDFNMWLNHLYMVNGWEGTLTADVAFEAEDPEMQLFNVAETPEYEEFARTARQWYNNGYWTSDVLANRNDSRDSFKSGKSGAIISNLLNFNELYLEVKDTNPTWDLEWFEMDPSVQKYTSSKYTANGMSINANSKNPEKAMELLELLRTNQEYFNLTTYGIEGVNYEITPEGKLTLPEGVTAESNGFPPDGACPWGWRQEKFYLSYENAWPKFDEMTEQLRSKMKPSPISAFAFDDENLKNEIAAITSVKQQYELPLLWGVVDVDEGLATLQQQLRDANIEKVLEEYQKQLDAFRAQ